MYNNPSYLNQANINPWALLLLAIIAFIVLGIIVQVTWNYTLPSLFGVKQISFLQALAILILLNILFGVFSKQCIQLVAP